MRRSTFHTKGELWRHCPYHCSLQFATEVGCMVSNLLALEASIFKYKSYSYESPWEVRKYGDDLIFGRISAQIQDQSRTSNFDLNARMFAARWFLWINSNRRTSSLVITVGESIKYSWNQLNLVHALFRFIMCYWDQFRSNCIDGNSYLHQ